MELTERKKLASSLTGYGANLSIHGAFQIVEDAITEHMGDLKIDGLTAKHLYNAVWVYTKTKIDFFKSLEWNSEFTLSCFISKISNVTIDIDVGVKNAADELCFYSRTELCALDLVSGRIRKVSTVGVDESVTAHEPLAEIAFEKFDTDDLPVANQVEVRYASIDYAVHTNNKEYVRFMLNTYTLDEMLRCPVREMQITFANQSFEGDVLTVHKGERDGKDVFVIQKDDKPVVKCQITRAATAVGQ